MQAQSGSGSLILDALLGNINESAAHGKQAAWAVPSSTLQTLVKEELTNIASEPSAQAGHAVTPERTKYERHISAALEPCPAPASGGDPAAASGRAAAVLHTPGDKAAAQKAEEGLRQACQEVQGYLNTASDDLSPTDELAQVLDYVAEIQRTKAAH